MGSAGSGPPAATCIIGSPVRCDHRLCSRNSEHSEQLGKVHRELSSRKRETVPEKGLKNKGRNTVSPPLCLSRCRGLGLFSLVVTKSVFPFRNHNFVFFQSSPTLIQTFSLEGLCARRLRRLHRKTFLYSRPRKTACSGIVQDKILNFQKISKCVYITSFPLSSE